jgi:hypothetical protein
MRLYFIAPLLLALVACASTEAAKPPVAAPVAAAAAPASGASGVQVAAQTCHREAKPGTNLYQTVCDSGSSASDRMDNAETARKLAGTTAAGMHPFGGAAH